MINFFYGYSLIWFSVLILYLFGWSDLCLNLDINLLIFLVFSIVSSFIIGKFYKKKLVFKPIDEQKFKHKALYILIIFYIVEFIIEMKIPLLSVLKGNSYGSVNFNGIPLLHSFLAAGSIIYSSYLSYFFVSTKNKKYLFYNIIIILYFLLLVQRQNLLICLLIFFNMYFGLYLYNKQFKEKKSKKKKRFQILFIILSIATLLYGFGIFGNMRYGSNWNWNDSSMIVKLGKQNENYPKIIPNEYFWSYIYLVSPLVNLNYNISKSVPTNNFVDYSFEYVPEYISSRLDITSIKKPVLLPVSSLTASTSYVRAYKYMGFLGMYIMFIIQMLIMILITNISLRHNVFMLPVSANCLSYVLLFTFFTNTFVYTTTSMILILTLLLSLNLKMKSKGE